MIRDNCEKPAPKPFLVIRTKTESSFPGATSFKVHFLEKKCIAIIKHWAAVPMEVAKDAPNIPMPQGNTKNQSKNMLMAAPTRVEIITNFGASSFRRKQDRKGSKMKNGYVQKVNPA